MIDSLLQYSTQAAAANIIVPRRSPERKSVKTPASLEYNSVLLHWRGFHLVDSAPIKLHQPTNTVYHVTGLGHGPVFGATSERGPGQARFPCRDEATSSPLSCWAGGRAGQAGCDSPSKALKREGIPGAERGCYAPGIPARACFCDSYNINVVKTSLL